MRFASTDDTDAKTMKPPHLALTPINRRRFLRGAGVSLSLPFLEGMRSVFGKESTGNQFFPGGLEIVGGAHQLTMSYLGSEAGHKNQFFFNNTLLKTTPGNSNQVFPAGQAIGVNPYSVSNGLLDFFFKANGGNGGTGLAPNGGAAAAFCTDCSIFVVFLDKFGKPTNPTAKDGFIVDIFFDDGGTNDNHDDMGIRISATPVPVPAALPILAAALAGFGFAGYRSRRDA